MSTHAERVIAEAGELSARSIALVRFMSTAAYQELPGHHKMLMRQQAGVMAQYADILTLRLAFFRLEENAR